MAQDKTITLRELFHNLGNKHYLCLLGSGMIAERLGDALQLAGLPQEARDLLAKAIEDLSKMEDAVKEADVLLDEIKRMIYAKVNCDEIRIDAEELKERLRQKPRDKGVF